MPARRSIAVLRLALPCSLLAFSFTSAVAAQQTTKSQNDPRPAANATLRQGEITIDGRLDEAAWAAATPITEFVQSFPDEGKPPSQKTELRVLYDANAIYIGARLYDSLGAKGVRSVLARRDQLMNLNGNSNLTSDKIAVLRWEYRPGSTLYFVWTQERDGFDQFGDFNFSRDRSALFRDRPTNIFQIKGTYWIGR